MKAALRFLVRLFPQSFREHFGAVIVEHARLDYERDHRAGRWNGLRSLLATAFDICRSGLSERIRPSWAGVPEEKGRAMSFTGTGGGAELRHAMRTLRRTPGFTATVVGTLGLAIGAIAAVFAVVDKVLLDPLPYAHSERLVSVAATAPGSEMTDEFGVAGEFFLE